MQKKHVVILGAGISGLATAWFLKQKYDSEIDITILEESTNCGGWIQTYEQEGFLFEKGPRSFRIKNISAATVQLIHQLGLEEHIITADPSAAERFIYTNEKLQALPNQLWKIPFSPLTKNWLKVLWNEWRQQKTVEKDETIYNFFTRRLGVEWTETLVDPVVSGIFAGDIRQLSVKSCFPAIYELEQKQGSLIKGFLFTKKKSGPKPKLNVGDSSLFSFKGGMKTLVEALASELENHLHLNRSSTKLILNSDSIELEMSNGSKLRADHLISTIPTYALAKLLQANHPFLAADLNKVKYASVTVVNLGYEKSVLKQKGFGYLIPSKEKEKILGCIWDSSVFPQQNVSPEATRLTLMLGGAHHPTSFEWSEERIIAIALAGLEKHLGLYNVPDFIAVNQARQAIPQYELGHTDLINHIHRQISFITQSLTCIGSAFNGVSVNDSIQHAYLNVENLGQKINIT